VYRLCHKKIHEQPQSKWFAVFVSNSIQSLPMFYQRASGDSDKACCWDYHVILLMIDNDNIQVYDLDSTLPYPCPLQVYLSCSFPSVLPPPFTALFRLVPAERYLEHFSSDRMHMFCNHTWNASPPPYDCILNGPNNLHEYRNFSTNKSNVVTLEQLRQNPMLISSFY
jgi:hypothetical protein